MPAVTNCECASVVYLVQANLSYIQLKTLLQHQPVFLFVFVFSPQPVCQNIYFFKKGKVSTKDFILNLYFTVLQESIHLSYLSVYLINCFFLYCFTFSFISTRKLFFVCFFVCLVVAVINRAHFHSSVYSHEHPTTSPPPPCTHTHTQSFGLQFTLPIIFSALSVDFHSQE